MDPVTLAAAALGLLSPFLGKIGEGGLQRVGETATDEAGQRLGKLYRAIKDKVRGDTYGEVVLHGAEEAPESTARITALEGHLVEILEGDPEFAALLERLVAEASGARGIQATDSGAVAGGNITIQGKYAAGRDLRIGPDE